jgi:hypothetical protein
MAPNLTRTHLINSAAAEIDVPQGLKPTIWRQLSARLKRLRKKSKRGPVPPAQAGSGRKINGLSARLNRLLKNSEFGFVRVELAFRLASKCFIFDSESALADGTTRVERLFQQP